MRKFQAALCGLLILCVQLFMPTAALAAAGDVSQSFDNGLICGGNFVALTANSSTAALQCGKTLPRNHTLQVIVTGTPAGGTCNLDGSLDGVTWSSLSGNQTCTSSVMFHVDARPVYQIRLTLSAVSGGTSPTWTAYYGGVR